MRRNFIGKVHVRSSSSLPAWFREMTEGNPLQLPRLPIPPLEDTISRYLNSIQPLVSSEEFQKHSAIVSQFSKTNGPILQKKLMDLDQSRKGYPFSYIEELWDEMYLTGRYPSPINVNPGYGLVSESDGGLKGSNFERVSYFLRSIGRFIVKMRSNQLENDAGPQCMSTFAKQFGTTRLPFLESDQLMYSPESNHITVLCRDEFFILDLFSKDGREIQSPTSLNQQLQEIYDSKSTKTGPISSISGDDRDIWAQLRTDLIQHDAENQKTLEKIDTSLFVVVLEDREGKTTAERSDLTLHGKGKFRWYDKLQVIVDPKEELSLNFEHSFSDGTAWNRWLNEVWHDMRESSSSGFSPLPRVPEYIATDRPEKLNWKLSNDLRERIEQSQERLIQFSQTIDTCNESLSTLSKDQIKQWKLSPDGVIQMTLQLAFQALYGKAPPTYESCATRQFLHGRTETIRSCSPAASAFIHSVFTNESQEKQRQAFEQAVQNHIVLAKEAQQGLGVDRHLYALRSIDSSDPFFNDPIRTQSSHFQLSTSNVTMPFLDYFCFGPVVADGYGIGYLIQNDHIGLNVTSFSNQMNSSQFVNEVDQAMKYIKNFYTSA